MATTPRKQFDDVLKDLLAVTHCHGCGAGAPLHFGEYCSKRCWELIEWSAEQPDCAHKRLLGSCKWCTEYVHEPFVHWCKPRLAAGIRMRRALDAFLFEHDSLSYEDQYWFRAHEYMLFAEKPDDFVAKWYWRYVFGCEPRQGTLPAHWRTYRAFMPLEQRAENERWPFYDSCYS